MRAVRYIAISSLLVLPSCFNTYSGVRPLRPAVGHPKLLRKAKSLRPSLRWRPSGDGGVTYDLAVYACSQLGLVDSVGKRIYYAEALKETEHRVDKRLNPEEVYYWSVRVRRGDQVSAWSRYSYWVGVGPIWWNLHFGFKTPG